MFSYHVDRHTAAGGHKNMQGRRNGGASRALARGLALL